MIDNLHGKSGRWILEEGSMVNVADINVLAERSDYATSSRKGLCYRAYYEESDIAAGTYRFVLDIPQGVKLIGLSRLTTIEEGTTYSVFKIAEGFTADTYNMQGYNFDETLDDRSASVLRQVTAVTNAVARTPVSRILSSTTGATRQPSKQTVIGFQPIFDSNHIPVFEYVIETGGAEFFSVELTWQEL